MTRSIGWAGIAGPVLLLLYFLTPLFIGWPFAGAPAEELRDYAIRNAPFFYAGAWLQANGTFLSVVFFLGLVASAEAAGRPSGLIVIAASTALLALVLVEAVFMVTVPQAATSGDLATVATSFTLANGVFTRIFAIVPAPATYFGLGLMLRGASRLPAAFATTALALAAAFALAGVLAIFTPAGVVIAIVLSVLQSFWIWGAAVSLLRAPGA